MNPVDSVRAACRALKALPLPQVVLFPGATMPISLHVPEPRYRDLVYDCMCTDRVMALVQIQPGWVEDAQSRPPLMKEIACAGTLVGVHENFETGELDVVLKGVVRVRILAQLPPQKCYCEVLGQVVEDGPYEGAGEQVLRQAVLEVCPRLPSKAAARLVRLATQNSGGALADRVGSAVVRDPERRRRILKEQSIEHRLQMVLAEVRALMAKLASGARVGMAGQ